MEPKNNKTVAQTASSVDFFIRRILKICTGCSNLVCKIQREIEMSDKLLKKNGELIEK